ncbi:MULTISPECIES: hypothetical protein [Dactylosporangium]|uniref:Uncharacterized protein n=2 Tax=Dactylosporangium TaxID=35753 RepID=A0A9W6KKN2_9ACTN|nr:MULTISPECIES: hypothetical protein [Dactylosporangium]UAC00167.1 hypothetical protein Dvina_20160 [Dactylosporangium vinaceum]GLL02284.1 hypothetical protein GCM10017581_040260 [Dactylosporangium matsuzakiense]
MTASFHPQPYPLYAITIEQVGDPAHFQLTDEPVRLVIGWRGDEQGNATPLLGGGSPGGTPWTGPVFYEETRDRAEETARQVAKGDRSAIRGARVVEAAAWIDRLTGQ